MFKTLAPTPGGLPRIAFYGFSGRFIKIKNKFKTSKTWLNFNKNTTANINKINSAPLNRESNQRLKLIRNPNSRLPLVILAARTTAAGLHGATALLRRWLDVGIRQIPSPIDRPNYLILSNPVEAEKKNFAPQKIFHLRSQLYYRHIFKKHQ